MRTITPLSNGWRFLKAAMPPATAIHFAPQGEEVSLPHTWNAVDGQDGGNDYYRGSCWYVRELTAEETQGERLFVEVNGAAMTCGVYLNGELLSVHEGGYSTFRVELTGKLRETNILSLCVSNEENDHVYPQKADFTFYGGLYRTVNLIAVPKEHFELEKDGTPGIKVTPVLHLPSRDVEVLVETWETGGAKVVLEIPTEHRKEVRTAEISDGHTFIVIMLKNAHLWDGVNDPYLYTVTATLMDRDCKPLDQISTRFGCRTIAFDPDRGFLLNGRPYPLRGVSRHQDRIGKGNALSIEDHREDIAVIREIGANTVRLAHYQQAQEFYDLCDENGLVVWAEIPYITLHMPNGRQNTLDQMRELITQSYNHPSIVCWGLSNEITAASPVDEDMMENHSLLNELCHTMDETRPTTMAHVFMLETDSPLVHLPDICSYNLYYGWYVGELEQNEEFFDEFHARYPDRVIGFSEYGADANPQFHSSRPDRGDYTEEYQCMYHEHILKVIEERPWLWATHVWNLFDFAADGRDEGGKNGQNQKGLVEFDHKTKKDAFYLYKAAWSKEPFVHVCGKRYADRAESDTQIKVYSNCETVTLFVDGKELETKTGKTVFTFTVSLSGEHEIRTVSGSCEDVMTIRRVDKPNEDYMFQKAEIVNWFDKEDYDPSCFSVNDKLSELMAHPQAGAIVGRLMEKAAASRGDVAKSTAGNANLQKMLGRMSLASIIKQAGDAVPHEAVMQLNAALQKIKK